MVQDGNTISTEDCWELVDGDSGRGYEFSQDWFGGREQKFLNIIATSGLKLDPIRILEIGSFEGRSACWFSDHLLDHSNSRLYCVDTFAGGPEHAGMGGALSRLCEKCRDNINKSKNASKVQLWCADSADALPDMRRCLDLFDLVYIDGSHRSEDVLLDAVNAWHMLRIDGVMIFDDYDRPSFGDRVYDADPVRKVADTIQAFFNMEIVDSGGQRAEMRALKKTLYPKV